MAVQVLFPHTSLGATPPSIPSKAEGSVGKPHCSD